MEGADIECAPARLADRVLVEGEVEPVQRHVLRRGSGIGVALPADGREDRGGEGRRIGGERELLEIEADLVGDVGRHARIGEGLLEIGAGDIVGAEAVVKHAELKLNSWRVGRIDQHALERGDGALVVADLRGEVRIFESDVEIGGIGQHLPEQSFATRLDLGRSKALHGDGGVARANRRCSAHGETGNRERDRPFRPPQHFETARPFPEALRGLIPVKSAPSRGKFTGVDPWPASGKPGFLRFSRGLWRIGHGDCGRSGTQFRAMEQHGKGGFPSG